jgi:4-nitrophenyl phosphatase
MKAVNDASGLLIDLDGVLWRGQTFLPGVKDFFDMLHANDVPFMLVTNNATVSPSYVVERLAKVDVTIKPEEVLTSALATAAYLKTTLPQGAGVYAIGEQAVRKALAEAGFRVLEEHESAKAVVVGFDRDLSWRKMTAAALAIQAGALFIGTNPDVSFPIEGGQAPGNGAIVVAIEAATAVAPVIVGKPEPLLFKQAVDRLGIEPAHALMVGDRLETDILGAQRAGIAAALLLTGITSKQYVEKSEIEPDFIFEDLVELTTTWRAGLD